MEKDFLDIPQMLLIGSSGRNCGKTTFAIALLQQWKESFPVIGLKVTTIHEEHAKCPRGGEGCGVCTNIKGCFEISEETNQKGTKDTSLLLAAGAEKVYWLKAQKGHIYEGIKELMADIPQDALIICESNSLRKAARPGVFIMLRNTGNTPVKESAAEVMDMADIVVDVDFNKGFEAIIDKIEIKKTQSFLAVEIKRN